MKSKNLYDKINRIWMLVCLIFILLIPLVLFFVLYNKSLFVFKDNTFINVLFSSEWKPLRGKFGFLPFIAGSVYVTTFAMLLACPLCLLTAIFITQYSRKIIAGFIQPVIDILAGIPSVVYGIWGIIVIVPFISKYVAPAMAVQSSGYSLLAGGIVLAVMIIPFILNVLIEVFKTIPADLTEVSLSVGATRWQTVKYVLLRRALPGIISAFVFGLSRAFGETIAVLMVIGNVVQIPHSLLDPAYPIPALIANNYGEMLSIPGYDSALMLAALILLVIVLIFNFIAKMSIAKFKTKIVLNE